jgi:hypothetical protein
MGMFLSSPNYAMMLPILFTSWQGLHDRTTDLTSLVWLCQKYLVWIFA